MQLDLDYAEIIFLAKELAKKIEATEWVLQNKQPKSPDALIASNQTRNTILAKLQAVTQDKTGDSQ